jgi:hypothetical protein
MKILLIDITVISLHNSQEVLCINCSQYKSCYKHWCKTWEFHKNSRFQLQIVHILANFSSSKESMGLTRRSTSVFEMKDKNYTFLQLERNCKTSPTFHFDITEHLNNLISKCDSSEELQPYLYVIYANTDFPKKKKKYMYIILYSTLQST